MSLRLTRVTARGFKQKPVEVVLEPVTLIVGPNGSGKSAILESISYALTGHVSGVKTTELGLLLPDPKNVAVVAEAKDGDDKTVSLSRGIQSKKRYARGRAFSKVTGTSAEANDASSIDSFVVDHFGPHAELFIQAFDPDKNIWSLSAEARLSWTFGVVARASGWTKDKLSEVFKDVGWGNIQQGRDVVECLDINIRGASEWMKSTAKSVREYDAIIGGLTDAISEPKPEEIAEAKQEVKDLRDKFSKSETKVALDRVIISIGEAELDISNRTRASEEFETLQAARTVVLRTRKERQEDADASELRRQSIERHHKDVELALATIESLGKCPTCGARYDGSTKTDSLGRWGDEQKLREVEMKRLDEAVAAWVADAPHRKIADEEFFKRERVLLELGAGQVADAEKKLAALKDTLAGIEDKEFWLESPATVRARLEEAEAKLDEITNRQQLALERAKKTADRDKAQEAAALWKGRHEKLHDARGRILMDARRSVEASLEPELDNIVAPHGGRWQLDFSDETGIDIAYTFPGGSFVKYKGMSSGERIVATVVLLAVLKRLIGATLWSALLVDNLELVSYPERAKLVTYVSTLSGLFSNIILLSSDPRPVGNVASIVCE